MNSNGLTIWKVVIALLMVTGPVVAVVTATVINHESRISVVEIKFDFIRDALDRIELKMDK